MTNLPKCYGIIPARYDSTRFPGKPLADILGKPMFWHVYSRAVKCPELSQVFLATDDVRIAEAADKLSVPTVMTRADHLSGTDRVLEAARSLDIPDDAVIVNIQGDEPTLHPTMLTALVRPFASRGVRVTTLARRISPAEAENPDQVKVVVTEDKQALYFSRAQIPYPRNGNNLDYLGHIGMYAFRFPILERFSNLPAGYLESIEKLEQLRLLENNIPIHVVLTEHNVIGVDRPEDIVTACEMLTSATP